MVGHRHIPYLSFHKEIIREICRPQKDDLLIMAKGLGMRRIICALLKTYDRKEDLVLVVNATPQDEAGIGDELGIMGVRDPGFRILTYEMSVQQREEMYRHGGLFSVTSKILINDFLKGNVPIKLITGLVVLHAERVHHGSQEEFAVRLYRRENQSGFCKAFSDEPETFAHGLSPLKDMLVNLNMNNVMVWPRYNEAVKTSLTTRRAEVAELYQPMTEAMRQCQDAVTECMEAMLVELKRDHSLNLDLEDLNVRNAQFKNFDTIVRMRLKSVWNKVGPKTKIHVSSLTELRNLQTWLLEYDSATFASYVNTLQRQHFHAQKTATGPGKHVHDWFNARSATLLVEASQARVSRKKVVMDNEAEDPDDPDSGWHTRDRSTRERSDGGQFDDDEAAMRDLDDEGDYNRLGRTPQPQAPQTARELREEEEDEDVMEAIATQSAAIPQPTSGMDVDGDSDDELQAITEGNGVERADAADRAPVARPPPVFRAFNFDQDEVLRRSVAKRLKKGHEPVLEELPKWSLLAKVLKEIEDTMARIKTSHAVLYGIRADTKAVLADITNVAKSGPDPSAPATESAVLAAVRKGIDKRREAANLYAPSGPSPHEEQHSSLSQEVALLSSFLPDAPSQSEVQKVIDNALDSLSAEVRSGKGAMGAAMKAVLEGLGGSAGAVDRKEVGRLVSEGLKKLGGQ